MKKIVIKLEYKCYPMWIYEDVLIKNDLADELRDDAVLDSKLMEIQAIYDNQFINTNTEFSYKTFSSNKEKELFKEKIANAVAYIQNKVGNTYIVEDRSDYSI